MPSTFANDGNVLTITQTSRGVRIGFRLFTVAGLLGAVGLLMVSRVKLPTTLACDRARGSCSLTRGQYARELPIASFTSTELVRRSNGNAFIALNRSVYPNYLEICGTSGGAAAVDEVAREADLLKAFFADANHPPLTVSCTSQSVGGPDPFLLCVLTLAGVMILMLLFRPFSTEVRTRIDRAAGTITVRGRRWFSRGWSVERPLTDVTGFETGSRSGAYGARYFAIYARFKDGSTVIVWAPGAASAPQVATRQAELQRFVAGQAA